MKDESPRRCSCCNLVGKKLKKCSRCQKVWYCNVDCQRKHFSVHKKDCKKWATEKNKSSNSHNKPITCKKAVPSLTRNKFEVQNRKGRGNCQVALSTIRKGVRIRDEEHNREYWEPLVLPALDNKERTSRCALCFKSFEDEPVSFGSPPNPMYHMFFCSPECRRVASQHGLEEEEKYAYNFFRLCSAKEDGPYCVYHTSIILYRLIRQEHRNIDVRRIENVRKLQGRPQNSRDYDFEEKCLAQAVITIAMEMVSSSGISYHPPMEYLVKMVERIKLNAFTVFERDGETCGIGIWGTPSFMNHSCRSNAFEVFGFEKCRPPYMYITAFQDIEPNQEICISYCNTTKPSHMRMARLEKDYHFVCNCEACNMNSDHQDDFLTMALRCPNCPSLTCSPVKRADKGLSPSKPVYECSQCHNTDFESSLEQLRDFETNRSFSSDSESKLIRRFQNLKTICYPNSWYVQEAGHDLLEFYFSQYGDGDDPAKDEQMRWKQLELAEEMIAGNSNREFSGTAFYSHMYLCHLAAKLRLLLVPDPRQSIQELQAVLSSSEPYFPKGHAAISDYHKLLESAMM